MRKIYTRWQKRIIEQAIKTRRILLLSGARQCGKTTLSKSIATNNTIYRTLDDITLQEAARSNPHEFIKHQKDMMIIDEIQHVPELLLAIKKVIDEDNRPGQYLLTGSSNIATLPNVKESLAGRVRKIRLRAFTQGELEDIKPNFITKAFENSFLESNYPCSQSNIIHRALKGGFPEVINMDNLEKKLWHKDYISSILERDLKDIANIKRTDSMKELIRILAAWSSKFMDITAIGSGLSIQRPTIESYINALETLYLVERLRPWTKTDYDRVGKQNKIFMTDCGLMASILGWKFDQIQFDCDRIGKLIETFIFNELASQIDCYPSEYELFHYRDREKREIDFIIEREDGSILGIEVKSGSAIDKKAFKHLKWFSENIVKKQQFKGIVLYTGENILSFGDNMWAIPITTLWMS